MCLKLVSDVEGEFESYLYWIREVGSTNIFEEGYVGVTTRPKERFQAHRSTLRNKDRAVNSYKESFIDAFNSKDLIMSIVDAGNLTQMLYKEYLLRPTENIGWNIAVGGRINQVCAKYKHGGCADQTMFQRFIKLLNECEQNKCYIDFNFKTDDGFKLFNLHVADESNDGVANKEVILINKELGFVIGNFVVRDKSTHADHDKWVFHENRWWSKKEACKCNGVDIRTADKRLTKYGMTREEAVGFNKPVSKVYTTVVLDGVECKYNTKLSSFNEEELVAIYAFYKSGDRGFKAFCKSLGVESANMIRYFKRYGLDIKVDKRSKQFRDGVKSND